MGKPSKIKASHTFNHCGRWDLNPHEHTPTRSLVLPVCQFQHFRISTVSYNDLKYSIVFYKLQVFFVKNKNFNCNRE